MLPGAPESTYYVTAVNFFLAGDLFERKGPIQKALHF